MVGILGCAPSQNSAQSAAWNHMLERLVVNAVYLPLDLGSSVMDPKNILNRILAQAQEIEPVVGFKVAVPYKGLVFELVSKNATGAALRMKTANTVVKSTDGFLCANTDGQGMRDNLSEAFGSLEKRVFLIVGAGAAAMSIGESLIPDAQKIFLTNRTIEKAHALCDFLHQHHRDKAVEVIPLNRLDSILNQVDCIINATPVGREGPWEGFSSIAPTHGGADQNNRISESLIRRISRPIGFASTLYLPERERLLQQALDAGHPVVNGLGMWLYQAARAAQQFFFPEELGKVPLRRIVELMKEGFLLDSDLPAHHAHHG